MNSIQKSRPSEWAPRSIRDVSGNATLIALDEENLGFEGPPKNARSETSSTDRLDWVTRERPDKDETCPAWVQFSNRADRPGLQAAPATGRRGVVKPSR